MGCKKITYRNFAFLEVVHRKNATENFILGVNRVHLGNVRLSYTDADGNGIIETGSPYTEIIQEKNYYPFGLTHQGYNGGGSGLGNDAAKRYGFGGKELQSENISGNILDWYDFHARNYDPALGRWMNIDPLAELMYSHSPYNYAFNNPVYFVDLDGLSPQGQCPEGSCDENPIALDEVIVIAPGAKRQALFEIKEGFTYWGENTGGDFLGGISGTSTHSIDGNDIPMGMSGSKASSMSGSSWIENLFNLVKNLFDTADRVEEIKNKIEGVNDDGGSSTETNDSSMGNKVEEEAKNVPKNIIKTIEFRAFQIKNIRLNSKNGVEDTIIVFPRTGTPEEIEKTRDSLTRQNMSKRNDYESWKKHLDSIN